MKSILRSESILRSWACLGINNVILISFLHHPTQYQTHIQLTVHSTSHIQTLLHILHHTYFTLTPHILRDVAHLQNATPIAPERHPDGYVRSLEKFT